MCRKQVLVGWGVMVGQGSAPEGFANEHSSSNSPPDDHHPHHDIHCLELLRSVRDDDNCLHVGIFSFKVFNFEVEDDDGENEPVQSQWPQW